MARASSPSLIGVGGGRKAPTPKLRALGGKLFEQRCAGCHGGKGDGLGPHAARLPVRPTNFTLGVYKLRSTPTGSIPTDRDLFITLTRGVHGTPMLPWKASSEEERWALVYRLEEFSVRFREERPASPIRVPTPPKEDGALRAWRRGRACGPALQPIASTAFP